ncbi:hypothetical protein C1H46_024949 [Malus baccata]|uniref:Uncharacterized protein n=1 Tax=Malus baccata TaxID=106549 RepID=A0A540LSJ6_MALBA|nr:hypothetical protein C1H46_024949 [Malus baccata]
MLLLGQFCSDDEPIAYSLESDKLETGSIESIGGEGEEDEEEEPVDEPDDAMEEDAVNPTAVFCIRLKQPKSNLQHKMSIPELCYNFRYLFLGLIALLLRYFWYRCEEDL